MLALNCCAHVKRSARDDSSRGVGLMAAACTASRLPTAVPTLAVVRHNVWRTPLAEIVLYTAA